MTWLGAAAASWICGATAAWALRRRRSASVRLALLTAWLGAACLAAAALQALTGATLHAEIPWAAPFGPLAIRLDPLSALFLLPIALLGGLAATFAPAYARLGRGESRLAGTLAALELLLASMALVVVAANTVLLLAAWELMTITSWYLLTSEHHDRQVRSAGLNYLIAGHVSGGALALLFVLMAQATGAWTIPLAPLHAAGSSAPPASLFFFLALMGFGTKAAVVPLHVWLPDAHAAAPSHVSAIMSGVLITLGFYGLVRFVPALGPAPPAWGMILMALGALGASLGAVMALSQRDVKRVLAYSTVENAGLITLAIGVALLAGASGQPLVAALAWSAALLHIWNHAVAKGLLFLAAGAVAEFAQSRDLERWGGLLRRQPLLGTAMIIGAAALVGLPGTNVFASEWLLFLSLFHGGQHLAGVDRLAMLLAVVAAAFAIATALACYVRIVGVGLLGHPRSREAAGAARTVGAGLAIPVVILSGACFGLVLVLGPMLALIGRAVVSLVPDAPGAPLDLVRQAAAPLPWLAGLPVACLLGIVLYRIWLRRRRLVRWTVTWDCGYARPEPSMQYTASSLPQPVTSVLQPALRSTVTWTPPRGLWPSGMSWESRTPERALAEIYRPAFLRLAELLGFFGRLQEGRVMVYLRYVGIALLVLLAWFFWPGEAPR